MCNKIKDIIGQTFGSLSIIEFSHKDSASRNYFECQCTCGNRKVVQQSNLLSGRSTSCGCSRKTVTTQRVNPDATQNIILESDEPYSFDDLDISSLPIITRGKSHGDAAVNNWKTNNPYVLKEVIYFNKGDRVVIKSTKQIGNTNSSALTGEFNVTLENGSIVTVESTYDVWLLCRYNDDHSIKLRDK